MTTPQNKRAWDDSMVRTWIECDWQRILLEEYVGTESIDRVGQSPSILVYAEDDLAIRIGCEPLVEMSYEGDKTFIHFWTVSSWINRFNWTVL